MGLSIVTHFVRVSVVIVGCLALFVALWVGALAFLAQDACLDQGGALAGPAYSCLLENGAVVPWFAMIRPFLTIIAAAVTGWPVYFLGRLMLRRLDGPL